MKLVVNRCYGGFGLSAAAKRRYMELKGSPLYFYEQTKYKHDAGVDQYERREVDQLDKARAYYSTTVVDHGRTTKTLQPGFWYDGNIDRDDPALIQVVEEMGKAANGRYAALEVVDIPADVEYYIDDYDGMETVRENHRTW